MVVWREGSGMVIFPFHLGSRRSPRVFGSSSFLTSSVLTRMLIGLNRHGVKMPSASRNCRGNFPADGGRNLSKTPSALRISCGPLLPSMTSSAGLPDAPLVKRPFQYSSRRSAPVVHSDAVFLSRKDR